MSYASTGLGKVFTTSLSTPFGSQKFAVDVPYEQVASSAVTYTVGQLEQQMPALLDKALKQAGGYVTGSLWPSLQPKLRVEVDRAIKMGEAAADDAVDTASKRAAMVAGGLVLTIAGAAWWIRSKR